ncbi:MAG: hypothetical protein JWN44_5920, partial [Myxococcales bacterium]|nr:hypothetical protein [Myxococcales bacterium]
MEEHAAKRRLRRIPTAGAAPLRAADGGTTTYRRQTANRLGTAASRQYVVMQRDDTVAAEK